MQNLLLERAASSPDGTPGQLTGMDFTFSTLEKPWLDNEPDTSCIPVGTYDLQWAHSPHMEKILPETLGYCYHVVNVPGRTGILIHNANRAEQLLGCIALGITSGVMPDTNGKVVKAVLQSKEAIRQFHAHMREEPAKLEIKWTSSPKE